MEDMQELIKRIDTIEKRVNCQSIAINKLIECVNCSTTKVNEVLAIWKQSLKDRYNLQESITKSEDRKNRVEIMTKQGFSVEQQAMILGVSKQTINNKRKELRKQGKI